MMDIWRYQLSFKYDMTAGVARDRADCRQNKVHVPAQKRGRRRRGSSSWSRYVYLGLDHLMQRPKVKVLYV